MRTIELPGLDVALVTAFRLRDTVFYKLLAPPKFTKWFSYATL